jgi:hypothetical protein
MNDVLRLLRLPHLLLLVTSSIASAQDGDLRSTSCVARDLAMVILIEARGEMQNVRPEALADATMQLIEARKACQIGRNAEALAVYDRIAALIGSEGTEAPKDP